MADTLTLLRSVIEDANRQAIAQFRARPVSFEWIPGSAIGGVYRYGKLIGKAVRDEAGAMAVSVTYRDQKLDRTVTWADQWQVAAWCELVDREEAARSGVSYGETPRPLALVAEGGASL